MASIPPSASAPTEGPPPPPPEGLERDEYEDFIEGRLHRTRRQVKSVDLAAALLTLFVGTLGYLLVAAILDHWVITGGLNFAGRLLLLAGLLVAGGYYLWLRILPLLIRRINPLFAAHTIEQSRPSLKNGLVNFLFLRRERREHPESELARKIYQGLEEKTAAELADPAVDMAVDRSEIIRLGYVLIAVVAFCALYLVFSPKNPLASFGRVILPWAKIPAPTRVAIRDVQPGSHTAFQGDTLTVSADVTGINAGEPVTLYYTTSDGQSVNQAVPMTVPEKQYRYFCNLPPGSAGLQQDLQYYIAAGDARTERFPIHVEIPLTILVDKVHYEYPKYTGIPDRDTTSGDIRAIEGTKVTVSATASQPIQRAAVEMTGNSLATLSMTANGTEATRQFTLDLDKERKPKYASYQLRFTDTQGRTNPRPIRHEIEVIADLPPNVRWIDPPDDEVQLPVNGVMELKLRAEDPDYALRQAGFHAERKTDHGNLSLPIAPLLEKHRPGPPHQGAFEGTLRFEPGKLGLKAGDKVVVWAEADDNREPVGNHSQTEPRTILIVEPQKGDSQQGTQQKQGQNQPQEGQPDQKQQNQPNQPAQGKQDRNDAAQQDEKPEQPKQDAQQPDQQQNQAPQQGQGDRAQQQQQKDQQTQEQQKENQEGQGSDSNQGGDNTQQQGGKGGNESGKQDQGSASQQQKQQQQKQQQQQGQDQSSAGGQQGQQGKQGQQGDQGQEGQQGQQGQQGKDGGKSSQGSQGQSAERQPVDPQTDAGQAFEEILDHQKQQQQQQGKQPAGQQQPQPSQKQQSQSPSQKSGQPGAGEKTPQPGQSQQPQQPQQSKSQAGGQHPQQDQPKEGQSQPQQPGAQQNPGTEKQQPGQQPETPNNNSGSQPQSGDKQPNQQSPPGSQEKGGSQPQPGQSQPGQSQPSNEKKPSGGGTSAQDQPSGTPESSPLGGKSGQQNKGGSQKPDQKSDGQPSDASLNKDRPQPGDPQSATGQKPPEGQGDSGSAGKQAPGTQPQPKPGEKASPQPGNAEKGQPQPSQGSPGAGKPSAEKQGTPAPQQTGQPGEKRPAGDRPPEKPSTGEPASPNTQSKESDSRSDAGGDRSGGGERGGGQKTPQPGIGSEGTQKEAQDGGQASDQPGKGETGSKPGQQAPSDQTTGEPTGQPGSEAGKPGSGKSQQQPGGKQSGEAAQGQSPQSDSAGSDAQKPPTSEGGTSGGQQPSGAASGSGNPTQGGVGGEQNTPGSTSPTGPLGADDPNLDYANKQTDLALDHLRHEMNSDRSDLLDRLGWTTKDAEQFIRQWEQLKQEAGRQDDQGRAARKELKDALDSLGLRPRGTQFKGGHTGTDRVRGLYEDRRFAPPKEYAEQVQAYTKGLSETKEPSTGSTPPPKTPGR